MGKIDFQGLLNVAKAGEENPELDMGYWVRDISCGTKACLIGSFCLANPEDELKLQKLSTGMVPYIGDYKYNSDPVRDIAKRFGISYNFADWLFDENPTSNMRYYSTGDAHNISGTKAIRRLRKFIYYKMKQEEIHEAWNERYHTKHAQCENTEHVRELQTI